MLKQLHKIIISLFVFSTVLSAVSSVNSGDIGPNSTNLLDPNQTSKKYNNFISTLTKEEQNYLKNKKIVTMCNNPNWTPIVFAKDGNQNEMQGIAIDILKEIEKRLDLKFKNIPTRNWKEGQQFLKDNKVDILPCYIKSAAREKYANFTRPYLRLPLAIFAGKDKPIVSGLDEIMDKSWTRQKSSGLIKKIQKEYPDTKIIKTSGDRESFQYVNSGKAYFTIATLPVASHIISKYMFNNLQIIGYTDFTYFLHIAVKNDDKLLFSILDKTLADISEDRSKEIFRKWVNQSVKEPVADYKLLGQILLIISIIGLFFVYRQHILKTNIAKLKIAKKQTSEEKERLNVTLRSIGDGVITTDLDGKIVLINKISEKLTGWSQQEAIGKPLEEVFHIINAKTEEPVIDPVSKALESKQIVALANHTILISKDNIKYQISDSAAPILDTDGNVSGVVLVFRDVTEEYRVQKELLSNAQRYKLVANNTSELIYELDLKTEKTNWFGDITGLLGYSISNKEGWLNALHPEDRDRVIQEFKKTLVREIDLFSVQYRIKHKDGSWRIWLDQGSFTSDETGEPQLWISACSDITEQTVAENARKQLSAAIEQASEIVMITDVEGMIQYVNPVFELITGYTCEEAIGQNPNILNSGKQNQAFYKKMWSTLQRGEAWSGHFINKKKDGSLYEEEDTISPVKNSEGQVTHFVAVKRDVSNEVSLEKQLRQAQKMEAIGTLAGGIAHDFNNILSAILGYAEIAREDLPEASQSAEDIDQVITAGKRATELVKQILTFSRKTDKQKKPLRIDLIVNEALKLLRSSLPTTIDIHTSIEKKGGLVLADPTSIHQIVVNLCTNASQAIGNEKGKLEVILEHTHLQPEQIADNPEVQAGPFLLLTVKDSGTGMDKKTVSRIFEPYFTTKKHGEGTGLGLAVIHGIVEDCNGMIKVESTQGKGTAFHVFLPTVTEKQPTIIDKRDKSQLPTGNERILYIDDEPAITHIGKTILTRFGYNVTTATNSIEALKIFQETPEAFDVVITDQTMPGLTGGELAQAMLELKPGLPIILCTGFTSALSKDEAYALGIKKFITKPPDKETLVKTVRCVLDESEVSTVEH